MGGTLRLPLTELSPEYHAIVIESLFAAGLSIEKMAVEEPAKERR
jgi:hypothetical protein